MARQRVLRPVTYVFVAVLILLSFHTLFALSLDLGPNPTIKREYERLAFKLEDIHVQNLAKRTNFPAIVRDVERIAVVREVDTPALDAVREFILAQFKPMSYWDVATHTFSADTPFGPKNFHNIVATWSPFGGGGAQAGAKRVILSAHYDSKYFADADFIGATDSAVSCALLIDLARTLDTELGPAAGHQVEGVDPNLSLQLVFFDGEEAFVEWNKYDNTYGARELAYEWHKAEEEGEHGRASGINNIELFVLLDLLGAKAPPSPSMPSYYPSTMAVHKELVRLERRLVRLDLIEAGGSLRKKGNFYFSSKPFNTYIEDDHIPFLRRHVPVVHLIPPRFPSVWHTAKDNLDVVDWQHVEDYAVIFRVFVAQYFHLPAQ